MMDDRTGNAASRPDSAHEALHATLMVQSMFEQWVETASFIEASPDLHAQAAAIGEALTELYQQIGAKLAGLTMRDE